MAVLLVEHDMSLVMNICDHVTVLDYGADHRPRRPGHRAGRPGRPGRLPRAPEEDHSPPASRAPTRRRARRASSAAASSAGTDGNKMIAFPRQGPGRGLEGPHAGADRRQGRLRPHRGGPRRLPRGPRRLGLRPARSQRGGQVDAAQGGERPDAGHHGHGVGSTARRSASAAAGPSGPPRVCAPSPKVGPSSPT